MFKKMLIFSAIIAGCTAKDVTAIDDFVEGEAKVAEKIAHDLSAQDSQLGKQKPAVELRVPVKKF